MGIKQNKLLPSRMRVKGRTCYQPGATEDARVQQNKDKVEIRILSHQSIKTEKRRTQQKSQILTYLLSFFSGGDFLSQPWKRISPPLMSAARFCLFAALEPLVCHWNMTAPGGWGRSKSCQRSGRTAAVCCLHWIKTKVVRSADVAGHTLPLLRCAMIHRKKLPKWGEKGAGGRKYKTQAECRAHIEIRSNRGEKLSWCGARKYRRVSAVCFPTHTTPTEQREGWAALGWTGWENRLHCSEVLRRAAFWAKIWKQSVFVYTICVR